MEPLVAEVDSLVAAMVLSHWPTSAEEFATWAPAVGMPEAGVGNSDMDASMPGTRNFTAPQHPLNVAWHFFRDEFTGVSLFPGARLAPAELEAFAHALRACFDARWAVTERLDAPDPSTGFATHWVPGESVVELYWHAPHVDPRGFAHSGAVQLAVDHRERARAQEVAAHERGPRIR